MLQYTSTAIHEANPILEMSLNRKAGLGNY